MYSCLLKIPKTFYCTNKLKRKLVCAIGNTTKVCSDLCLFFLFWELFTCKCAIRASFLIQSRFVHVVFIIGCQHLLKLNKLFSTCVLSTALAFSCLMWHLILYFCLNSFSQSAKNLKSDTFWYIGNCFQNTHAISWKIFPVIVTPILTIYNYYLCKMLSSSGQWQNLFCAACAFSSTKASNCSYWFLICFDQSDFQYSKSCQLIIMSLLKLSNTNLYWWFFIDFMGFVMHPLP